MTSLDWRKQLGDQALHLVIGAVAVFVLATIFNRVWPGIAIVALGWIRHEYNQWPSSRWWDPPLDWTFQVAGIVIGAWWYL